MDKLQLKIRKRQRKARFHFLTFHVLGKADWKNAYLEASEAVPFLSQFILFPYNVLLGASSLYEFSRFFLLYHSTSSLALKFLTFALPTIIFSTQCCFLGYSFLQANFSLTPYWSIHAASFSRSVELEKEVQFFFNYNYWSRPTTLKSNFISFRLAATSDISIFALLQPGT